MDSPISFAFPYSLSLLSPSGSTTHRWEWPGPTWLVLWPPALSPDRLVGLGPGIEGCQAGPLQPGGSRGGPCRVVRGGVREFEERKKESCPESFPTSFRQHFPNKPKRLLTDGRLQGTSSHFGSRYCGSRCPIPSMVWHAGYCWES